MLDSGQRFEDLDLMHFALEKFGWYARLKGGAQMPILFLLMREVNWELGLDPLTVTDIRIIANQPFDFAMLQWSRASVSSTRLTTDCDNRAAWLDSPAAGLLRRDSQFTNRTGTGQTAESPRCRFLRLAEQSCVCLQAMKGHRWSPRSTPGAGVQACEICTFCLGKPWKTDGIHQSPFGDIISWYIMIWYKHI